jgi:hypothetical protein
MWCPPKKTEPKTETTSSDQKKNRVQNINGRAIEDVPPEDVEPVRNVIDIKR